MTVLNPEGRVAGISVESLAVKLGGEFPLPRVPGAIGNSAGTRPSAHQTGARLANNAVQCHFTPKSESSTGFTRPIQKLIPPPEKTH